MGKIKELIYSDRPIYKANLHSHSTCSDGKLSPEELKKAYKDRGYQILSLTDHEILLSHSELNDEDFFCLPGYEISFWDRHEKIRSHRRTCHINLYPKNPTEMHHICYDPDEVWGNATKYMAEAQYYGDIYKRAYTPQSINHVIEEAVNKGYLVSYNHPAWSLEPYEYYSQYRGFYAMEICNYSCTVTGLEEHNQQIYDSYLRNGYHTFCVATDDNHNSHPIGHPLSDSFGGFTMLQAESLTHEAIIEAMEKGHFYASTGPIIHKLYVDLDDYTVHLRCSAASDIYYRTFGRRAIHQHGNEAVFQIDPNDVYFRIDVTDVSGEKAYTNAYFVDDLESF